MAASGVDETGLLLWSVPRSIKMLEMRGILQLEQGMELYLGSCARRPYSETETVMLLDEARRQSDG